MRDGRTHAADRAATRALIERDELRASAIRALAGDPGVRFRDHQPYSGRQPITMLPPHLRVEAGEDVGCQRGAADGLALRLLLSDPAIHRAHRPDDHVGALIFDELEQFRVESRAPLRWPGVAANVRHRVRHWLVTTDGAGLTHTETGILLQAVAAAAWSGLTGERVPQLVEEVIEPARAALSVAGISGRLAKLRRLRDDQAGFAPQAAALAQRVVDLLGVTPERSARRPATAGERALAELLFSGEVDAATGSGASSMDHDGTVSGTAYQVFTTAYDQERATRDVVRPAQAAEFRQHLDELIARAGLSRTRIRRQLLAQLAVSAIDGWDHGRESGRLDGRRLACLVTTPDETRIFRAEATTVKTNATVTFLLDCSGSMREHATSSAVLVDTLARGLDEVGARCEILGFTTGGWNGGQSHRAWNRAGRPAEPGRLNDRLHLIFKAAEVSWRGARREIAALFKADLFREGIDGEAVRWASARLQRATTSRRILVVLSDGGPSDTATATTNPSGFLDRDLVRAVTEAESQGVDVRGVSFGSNLGRFYPHCLVLPPNERPSQRALDEVIRLLNQRPNS